MVLPFLKGSQARPTRGWNFMRSGCRQRSGRAASSQCFRECRVRGSKTTKRFSASVGVPIPFVSQSERQSEVGVTFQVSVTKAPISITISAIRPVGDVSREASRLVGQKGVDAGESESARRIGEIVRILAAVFAAELDGVIPVDPAQRVGRPTSTLSPRPCGNPLMPPNVKAPETVICGSPMAAVTPLLIPNLAALIGVVSGESDVDAVEARGGLR